MKGEQELGNTIHREIKNTPTKAFISVKEAKLSDGGQYILLLKNPGGEKTVQVNVVVLDKPGEPQGPLVVTGITKDRCCLAWKPPLQDGGSKICHYIVERRETSRLIWTVVEQKVENICLKVTKLLEGNEYIFRVRAVNQFGVGAPLESPAVIIKDPYMLPGSPKNLEVSNIKKDSMVLTWEAPSEDGGSPVTGYIIEKHDKEGVRWTRCNRQTVTDLSFKVKGLLESHNYEFRVAAENSVGVGEPSSPTVFYKALDPIFRPGPPHNPRVTDTTRTSVFLSWGKPISDGGCEIQGYIVECCTTTAEAPAAEGAATDTVVEEWIMCTPATGVKKTKFEVANLKENQAYKFRVCAINKVGVGEHADVAGIVVAMDRADEPDLDIDPELRKIVTIKAGASLRLFIPIKGRPTPTIKWDKDEAPLKESAQVEITSSYTLLVIDKMSRNDSGKYTVSAENSSGTKSALVVVRVLDTPSAPVNLKVKEITNQSVTLEWEPPLLDGGSKIKNYIVEKRESTRKTFEYKIQVCALNKLGVGEPAVLSGTAKPEERVEPPEIHLDSELRKGIVLKAGGSVRINIPFKGRPTPEIKWTKDDGNLTEKPVVEKAHNFTQLSIDSCDRSDSGKYTLTLTNSSVVTSDRAEAPEIELDAELRKVLSVRAGGTLRLFVTIRGRPEPAVKWEKVDSTLTERAVIDTTSSFTMLVIDNVNRFDSGKYSLTLENSSGKKSAIVAVRILDTPSAPQNFTVKELKKDSVTLAWDTPLTDGGSKITNYIIEKRESVRKAYAAVTSNCTANSFKVEDLPEGGIFYFRICAVNEYGQGQMVETKEVKVAEVPLPPSKVTLVDLTKTSVSLAWEKPAHDGGCKVMCYNVEFKPKSGDKWGTACTVKVPEATIPNLTPNEAYLFRVVAINEKGKSEPKDLGLPVVAKDVAIEPSINLLFTTYTVKAGGDLTFEVPIRGRPKPAVSWKKDGLPLKQTTSVSILNTAASSKIIIKEAKKEHVGKYEMTLANTAGTVTTDIGVIVLDNISLSWSPPEYDGGCSISNYIVEKRDTNTQEWQMIASNVARTAFKAGRLTHGAEYQFRIYAVNRYGKSSYLDSPGITAQYNFKQPGPPSTPIVKLATKSYMLVTWNEPVSDGGSPVLGYHLERKERSSILWTKMNRGMIKDTEYKMGFTVSGLTQDESYEFRVYAKNAVGSVSNPSLIAGPVTCVDACGEHIIQNYMDIY
uniref:Titin n=1 Tax=Haplochromis burtoni TaxID=8153 RepID=A0A3Q2W5L4_HAPBU